MSSPKPIDLRAIARLARLHLSDEEIKYFETQVSGILAFVEKLNELKDLENVPPTSHPLNTAEAGTLPKTYPQCLLTGACVKAHSPYRIGGRNVPILSQLLM